MNNTYLIPFLTNMLSLPPLLVINLAAVITATRHSPPWAPAYEARPRQAPAPDAQ